MNRRAALVVSGLVSALVTVAGCGLKPERLTGPAPGGPQLMGTVSRSGVAVAGMEVKLYQDPSGVLFDTTRTDASGAYGFANVPAGRWMVKVSPSDPNDLAYVRYFLDVAAGGVAAEVPPFDVAAHGFGLISPTDGSAQPLPTSNALMRFAWSLYQGSYVNTSARVADSTGVLVWASAAGQGSAADWDGTGNDGSYAGRPAAPGHYRWRVKIRLAYDVQAATRERLIVLGSI
jgi:SdrD B-like protein